MRTFLIAASAALTAGFISVAPAHATYWKCMGSHVACGSGSSKSAASTPSYKKSTYQKSATKKAYKKTSSKSYSGSEKKKVSYSSGSSGGDGLASYYWQPQRVASGGWFNPNALTAAHKTLPFGTKVRVTNKHNGKSVVVTINDRGPYVGGRVIDLSSRAAGVIGMKGAGVVPISLAVLGR